MDIKTISKRAVKGQAILDLKKQIEDSLNVVNSAVLNLEAAIKEMKTDSDFNLDEMQEFKNIINYAITESLKKRSTWIEKYNSIVIE
jgi:hypothetical protein